MAATMRPRITMIAAPNAIKNPTSSGEITGRGTVGEDVGFMVGVTDGMDVVGDHVGAEVMGDMVGPYVGDIVGVVEVNPSYTVAIGSLFEFQSGNMKPSPAHENWGLGWLLHAQIVLFPLPTSKKSPPPNETLPCQVCPAFSLVPSPY